MILILGLVGLLMAMWAWNNVHPVVGLIVGFLFIGGAGWKFVFGLLGLARPSARHAYGPEGKQFIHAWEARFGEMRPGRQDNLPPPGAFQTWLADYKRTGVDAGTWLDRETGVQQDRAILAEDHCELAPIMAAQPGGGGRAYALSDGIVVNLDSGPQVHLGWAYVKRYGVRDDPSQQSVEITFGPGAGSYSVTIATADPEPWIELLQAHQAERHY